MPMTVVLDANVLFPQYLCDLLLSFADAELFRPVWSKLIHDEWMQNVIEKNRGIDPERIKRRQDMMDKAFPDACVSITDQQVEEIEDVHIKDRHVMAAAKIVHADGILTFNHKDFPKAAQRRYGVPILHPDDFVCDYFDRHEMMTLDILRRLRAKLKKPAIDAEDLTLIYFRSGLSQFAKRLTSHLDQI
jgi:predicted nucleic acid-binding protein